MSLFVLDTDILTLYYRGMRSVVETVHARSPADLTISIITVDEQLHGWHSLTQRVRLPGEIARAYANLGDAVVRLSRWRILPYTESAITRFAEFKNLRLNVGAMDLRIASVVLEHSAVMVTRNRRDFSRIPGLVIEDWSV